MSLPISPFYSFYPQFHFSFQSKAILIYNNFILTYINWLLFLTILLLFLNKFYPTSFPQKSIP